jgi:polyphosphate:AMP phosphotransferase
MFESADLEHHVAKATWRREEPRLREALLNAQFDLSRDRRFPVLIVIGGVEGAGKGETVNLLHEWMDPRHIQTTPFAAPRPEEAERPPAWRFWRALPPRGKIGIFFGAWHSAPILDLAFGRIDDAEFERRAGAFRRFEKMLADEGTLLLKFWFHLSKSQQRKRLRRLSKDKRTRWRVTRADWKLFAHYDELRAASARLIRATNSAEAPWLVVPGADPQYRALMVGRTLLSALRARLDTPAAAVAAAPPAPLPQGPTVHDHVNVLRALELDQPMTAREYERELDRWQGRLAKLTRRKRFSRIAVAAVFEGNDAAGKGGAIRRVTQAIDARIYRGVPIAAPTEEERAQPYLWRFWRQLPERGHLVFFDRSWYGRVLVERVEGFCAERDWMRAYDEINDFEAQLVAHGIVVAKFWLAIDPAEQLRRFRAREKTSFKRFKITPEDWRNRKKWTAYEQAVADMVERTSTDLAPWTLVEADNKLFARIKVLRTLCEAIEAGLERA